MNPTAKGLIVGIVAAAAALIWYLQSRTTADIAPHQKQASVAPRVQAVTTQASPSPSYGPSPNSINRRTVSDAHDYWALAHQLLPMAQAGDADAQFFLYDVLHRCASDNRMFFTKRGRHLSLDEGVQYAAQRHLSIDLAQSIYQRCHEFLDADATDLGNTNDWLARATLAGQPIAQATTASRMLLQEVIQSGGGVPDNPDLVSPIGTDQDPRLLFLQALPSMDPEVLFEIGSDQHMLNPTEDEDDELANRLAWWLVSCQRGLNCSSTSEWAQAACPEPTTLCSFSGNSSNELIEHLAKDHWDQVQNLAATINDKLNAHEWDALLSP